MRAAAFKLDKHFSFCLISFSLSSADAMRVDGFRERERVGEERGGREGGVYYSVREEETGGEERTRLDAETELLLPLDPLKQPR